MLTIDKTMAELGSVVVGQTGTPPATFTIKNTGGQTSGSVTVSVTGDGFSAANTCGASGLAPNGMCTVTVTFKPNSVGSKSGQLSVSAMPGGVLSAALSGTAVPVGDLSVSPNLIAFPDTAVGSMSGAQVVTIKNTGGSAVNNVMVAVGDAMNFGLNTTCMGSLMGGASCTASVTFTPKTKGAKSSSLSVTGGTQSLTVALSGNGQTAPQLVIQPASANVSGIVNTASPALSFIVGNSGDIDSGTPMVSLTGTNMADFTISNNTCVTPIKGLSTCTVEVTFKPAAVGTRMANLVVAATPGGMVMSPITGTAVDKGTLDISPSPADLGMVTVGSQSAAKTLTVKNSGGSASGALSVTLASTEFTKGADTCTGVVLAPNATCTIDVTITAASAGIKSAVLVVSGGSAGQGVVTLNATAAAGPTLSVSPSSLAFGNANSGTTSAAQMLTITNVGAASTGVPVVSLIGMSPDQFSVAGNGCTAALAPAGSCTISVVFKPTLVQASTATVQVSATPGNTITATLSGSGVAPGNLAVFPSAAPADGLKDFGNVVVGSQSDPATSFTVKNNGTSASGTVTIALAGVDAASYVIASNGCMDQNLAPGATCVVTVRFKPARVATLLVGSLTATASGGTGSVVLNGRGLNGVDVYPQVETDQSPYDHGTASVGTGGTDKRFWVFVRGDLGAITLAVTGGASDYSILDNAVGTSHTCQNYTGYASSGANLPVYAGGAFNAGGSAEVCSFDTHFVPAARGVRTGEVTVTAGTASAKVALTGTGVGPLVIQPATYAFTDTAVGATQNFQFTVNNNGGAASSVTEVLSGANAGEFSITANTCGTAIGGAGTCNITITFQPTSAGAKTVTLTVAGTIAAASESIAATITGTAVAMPGITLAPLAGSSATFPATVIGVAAADRPTMTYVVTNTGATSTGIIDVALFGAGFGGTGDYAITSNGCGAVLPPSGTCQVQIKFSPLAGAAGTRTALLRAIGAPGGTSALPLTGTSTPNITVTTDADGGPALSSLDFGFIPVSTASGGQYFRVYNKGAALAAVITPTYVGAGDYPQNAATNFIEFDNQCTSALTAVGTAGEYCRYGVRAAANATPGTYTGRVKLTVAGNSKPAAYVDLKVVVGAGSGQAGLAITNKPTTSSTLGNVFKSQPGSDPYVVTVKNNGGAAGAITVTWDGAATVPTGLTLLTPSGTACATGVSLAAGATCNLSVKLDDTASAVAVSSVLKFCITGTTYCDQATIVGRVEDDATQATLLGHNTGLFGNHSTITFASVDIDTGTTTDVKTVTITNRSDLPITLRNAATWKNLVTGTQFSVAGSGGTPCAANLALAAGASCTIDITFDPTTVGLKQDVLTLMDTTPQVVATIPLFGTGTDDVAFTITLPLNEQNDFGDVNIGTTKALAFTVTNTGTATSQAVIPSVGTALYSVSGCGGTLAAGASCTATVTFAPTVAGSTGTKGDTLTITAGAVTATQAVTGRAVNDAAVNLTAGTTLTYTNQYTYTNSPTAAAGQIITVRNGAGGDTLNDRRRSGALSIAVGDTTNYYINNSTCVSQMTFGLDPGATCNFTIDYLPQAQDVSNPSTATVAATPGGSGVSTLIGNSVGAIQWEQPGGTRVVTKNFGSVAHGTTSGAVTFTVTNQATADTNFHTGNLLLTSSLASGQYTVTADNCTGQNLAVGGSCTVLVTVTPTAAGAVNGSLTISGAPGFSATVTLTTTGT